MAVTRNKMIPLLGMVALAIVGTIVWMQASGPSTDRPRAAAPMSAVPGALPPTKGADHDTPTETLQTVVTSNRELRGDVQKVLEENQRLRDELRKRKPSADVAPAAPEPAPTSQPVAVDKGGPDVFDDVMARASRVAGQVFDSLPNGMGTGMGMNTGRAATGVDSSSSSKPAAAATAASAAPAQDGLVQYKVKPPMGYAIQTTQGRGRDGVPVTSYVRTSMPTQPAGAADSAPGPAQRAADGARDARPTITPYFTIPENATLAGVASMTSMIGRVPIDGKVTDPMQWKAVVGRDNLAANGFELPDDLAGIIVTGIAIGDMALSCSEGKVRSLTVVFNDGSIRTISTRRAAFAENRQAGSGGNDDLGYVSDLYGNPCIGGKFVTNAPSYLTDIVGVKTLEVAGQAYAEAQRTVSQNAFGGATSSITGSTSNFVLGQAVAGASDEVSKWLLARLKNSFDAVVTPAGQRLVLHLDQEIRLDKRSDARRLVYRQQPESAQIARGSRHGLE